MLALWDTNRAAPKLGVAPAGSAAMDNVAANSAVHARGVQMVVMIISFVALQVNGPVPPTFHLEPRTSDNGAVASLF